ncbi:MAG: hypothetical protein J7L96_08155 [Bacteroidales bacterium]|nr:hypothetical protein [Bacteroidales bacterium]
MISSTNKKLFAETCRPGKLFMFVLVLLLLFSFTSVCSAQLRTKADSSNIARILRSSEHSAAKAAIFSALVPGWGQAYNKKYWKIPIVYAGLATVGYFIYDNHSNYLISRDDYIRIYNDPNATVYNKNEINTKSGLLTLIDSYRKNRDLSVIIMFAVWGLNIVDANVDGHFYNFDINDDLTIFINPASGCLSVRKNYLGLSMTFELH